MSQRLLNNTKWLWCVLVLHAGSFWGQTGSVSVRSPTNNPSTIESQAKFFQYRHLPKTDEFNQGHRLGSERHFTERHERARPSEGLFSAKVRWGDKKGGYGEHYWDLNHAGNAGHDDGDDGSYHQSKYEDPYDEPSDDSPTYGTEEYNPERSSYEESGRAKRAHPKIKAERKRKHSERNQEEPNSQNTKRKNKDELETAATHESEEYAEDDEEQIYEKPKRRHHYRKQNDQHQQYRKQKENQQENSNEDDDEYQSKQKHSQEENQQPKEKNQIVLVVSEKDDSEKPKQQFQPYGVKLPQYVQNKPELNQYVSNKQPDFNQYVQRQPDPNRFVPYEGGAGVRQHHQPDVSAATTVPRLFLEPSTGHVVDRATGQAYVLQPIAPPKNY